MGRVLRRAYKTLLRRMLSPYRRASYHGVMNINGIRQRVRSLPPWYADLALAVLLALLACLQIAMFDHFRESVRAVRPTPTGAPPMSSPFQPPRHTGWLEYVIAIAAFLPLALKRKWPTAALLLSGTAAVIYSTQPWPTVFIVLGPMIALHSLASTAKTRRRWVIAVGVAALVLMLPALYYTEKRWVAESVGMFALLVAAAFLGDTARSRREYIEEVERRAREAERAHEEEARRRIVDERLRIARDVHDVVAHSLSIITVQAAAADALIGTDGDRARESIGHVRDTSRKALSELRSMLGVLRESEATAPLSPLADLSNLTSLIEQVRDAGLAVELRSAVSPDDVSAAVSLSAYRIVQEALTNVVRHAHARKAVVNISADDGLLLLEVSDDGVGGDVPEYADGHGVKGMQERAEALNGIFEAGPDEGGGFRVKATLPLSSGGAR